MMKGVFVNWTRPYVERKMDCLYDYILSQNLCDVEE